MKSVFFFLKDAVLLHFAVTSSVTVPVEEGGGEGRGVSCLSFTVRFSDFVKVFVCDQGASLSQGLLHLQMLRRQRKNFTPTLVFTL